MIILKLQETLVDLLSTAGRRPSLPMVVCCSTRDELDAVCSAVSNLSYIDVAAVVFFTSCCLFWKFLHSCYLISSSLWLLIL